MDFAAFLVAGEHLPVFLQPMTAPKNFFCLVERDGTLLTSVSFLFTYIFYQHFGVHTELVSQISEF